MVMGSRTKGNTVKATLAMGPIELSLAPSAPIRILKKKLIVKTKKYNEREHPEPATRFF
jgi:hypothetical protein